MDVFRHLRVRQEPFKVIAEPGKLSAESLAQDSSTPITLRQINDLPEPIKRRIYRVLIPCDVLHRFGIDPMTWKGRDGNELVRLRAEPAVGQVNLSIRAPGDSSDEFFTLEIADNAINGVDLHFILLADPNSPRFNTDYDAEGHPTLFGTTLRNFAEEERAMRAGLAPAQVRASLGASRQVLDQLELFMITLGHRAYFLEPLTYVSAWIFERRGLAYVRGHKLMEMIHAEFQPGGALHRALDGSTPFRQPEQWRTVRGRAWAIHDGILGAIGATWDGLRMIKQVGRHAGVDTFPSAVY